MNKITRRTALYAIFKSSLVISAGFSLITPACNNNGNGNGCPSPENGGNCPGNGTNITICTNHGHTMTLSATDVNNAIEQNYTLTAGNGHTHTVFLTAAHFTELQANRGIKVTSSVDSGHNHDVVINCA